MRNVRNLFGAPEHCLEGGRQYSCTLAPVCWVTGGVASAGDDDDDSLDRDDDIDPDTVLVTRLWSACRSVVNETMIQRYSYVAA